MADDVGLTVVSLARIQCRPRPDVQASEARVRAAEEHIASTEAVKGAPT